jgi:hypothetical protein
MIKPDLIPSRGAIAEPLLMEVTRELTADDLLRLGDAPKVNVPVIQKLRAVHHRQAQLLAQGKTPSEVAVIVGCTVQRLVQLRQDPTFSELVVYYHDQMMVASMEDASRIQGKLVDAAELAVDEILERMENEAGKKKIPIGELRQIAELGLDRTVAPPKTAPPQSTAPNNVTINFGTPIRQSDPEVKVIEAEVEKE